jgi:uncharacterized protein (TIGR02246 family)
MTTPAEMPRSEIVALYTRLLEAWNQREPDAFAALFTENGSTVGFDGSQMNGRAEIAAALRAIFTDHPTATYVAKVREVRPIDSRCTLVRAVVAMVPPGKSELNPAANAIQSLVVILDHGQLKIALLQNTPAAFHGRPHLSDQLTAELSEVLGAGQIVEAG